MAVRFERAIWYKVTAAALAAVFLTAIWFVAAAVEGKPSTLPRQDVPSVAAQAATQKINQNQESQPPLSSSTADLSVAPQDVSLPASQIKQIVSDLRPVPNAVPVLMYHYVGDLPKGADATRRGLTVSAADFSAQLDYLQQKGYETITTAQLYGALSRDPTASQLPAHPVIITFDDGHSDVFTLGIPLLKAHGMVGSFAVITGFIGTSDYASWTQVIDAERAGMEVVSHSFNHIDFSSPEYQDSYRDWSITLAQDALVEYAGDRTQTFVYPFGKYCAATEAILRAHGYTLGFTTAYGLVSLKGGKQDMLALPRVRVSGGESIDRFALSLNPSELGKLNSATGNKPALLQFTGD